jgi:hypothetical protein
MALAQDFMRLDIPQQQAILAFSQTLAGINAEDATDLDPTI